jgi:hypothetical protein
MPDSTLFSIGVERLLRAVRPYGGSTSAFPPQLNESEFRRNPGETLHAWFVRAVDGLCGSDPKRAAVEDNIACFIKLSWKDRRRLIYASAQTVVATCDLEDYYLDADREAQYLRLDFDYHSLGKAFSHPLVHIHTEGDLSPRFALDGGTSGNVVVDYLEFLYRNYAPAKWLKWAEHVWEREFRATANPGDLNHFPTIIEAFENSQIQILRDHAALLGRIKRALRTRKDDAFGCHMEGTDREILEYPLAR